MTTQTAGLTKADGRNETQADPVRAPIDAVRATASERAIQPYRKRLFFHFEIGFKRTRWCADRAAAPNGQPDEAVVQVTQPVLAFSSATLKTAAEPPAPAAPQAAAAIPPAPASAASAASAAGTAGTTGAAQNDASNGGGGSALYVNASVGTQTETPPYGPSNAPPY
jgi:hypothetical protein